MAASNERWYFTKEQIQNTPSRKSGVDAEKELSYRQQAANLIQDMGQRLSVTQLCINTAIVYMHRFYMFHSFTKFHRNQIAACALFLAAKVEEQPRKLEHVITVQHMCLNREARAKPVDTKSEEYLEQAQQLIMNENIMLQTLGFDIDIVHPHRHVVNCCQLVRATKDLAQTSYFMATNSLHLTTFCLQYNPKLVACVCIHLACKWAKWEIPLSSEGKQWWWYINNTVTLEQLESITKDFLAILEKTPSRLKSKIMKYKSDAKLDYKPQAKSETTGPQFNPPISNQNQPNISSLIASAASAEKSSVLGKDATPADAKRNIFEDLIEETFMSSPLGGNILHIPAASAPPSVHVTPSSVSASTVTSLTQAAQSSAPQTASTMSAKSKLKPEDYKERKLKEQKEQQSREQQQLREKLHRLQNVVKQHSVNTQRLSSKSQDVASDSKKMKQEIAKKLKEEEISKKIKQEEISKKVKQEDVRKKLKQEEINLNVSATHHQPAEVDPSQHSNTSCDKNTSGIPVVIHGHTNKQLNEDLTDRQTSSSNIKQEVKVDHRHHRTLEQQHRTEPQRSRQHPPAAGHHDPKTGQTHHLKRAASRPDLGASNAKLPRSETCPTLNASPHGHGDKTRVASPKMKIPVVSLSRLSSDSSKSKSQSADRMKASTSSRKQTTSNGDGISLLNDDHTAAGLKIKIKLPKPEHDSRDQKSEHKKHKKKHSRERHHDRHHHHGHDHHHDRKHSNSHNSRKQDPELNASARSSGAAYQEKSNTNLKEQQPVQATVVPPSHQTAYMFPQQAAAAYGYTPLAYVPHAAYQGYPNAYMGYQYPVVPPPGYLQPQQSAHPPLPPDSGHQPPPPPPE